MFPTWRRWACRRVCQGPMSPHPPVPGVSAPLSHPSPSHGLSPCALPRVFHPQPAGLGPERAQPLAKPHSHPGQQSAPPGSSWQGSQRQGAGGGWLKWRQETGPGGMAPRLWRALRGETREAQAQLRQERETETGVPGGALSDLSHCASRASALFSDKRGDGARQGLLPPALLTSPAVFKKTHAFPLHLEIGAIRYGLSLSFSLS